MRRRARIPGTGSSRKYDARIARGLDKVYASADEVRVPIDDLRVAIFSDHHRGQLDGADDFKRCEPAYRAALGFYEERGYHLWLLGDVEELFENAPRGVIETYEPVLELEGRFLPGRLRRFYGNHDATWGSAKQVKKFLGDHAPAKVHEGLKVHLMNGSSERGVLFLVHGHQGTRDAGSVLRIAFARFVVRHFWAPLQRAMGFALTGPSGDAQLRGEHDSALYHWARARALDPRARDHPVLITGHTHRPVFPGEPPADLEAQQRAAGIALQAARSMPPVDPERVAAARAEHELARARLERWDGYRPPAVDPPCYFNTGCASFGDGDVTGLEIADGEIRLVRWLDNDGRAQGRVLARRPLDDVLGKVAAAAEAGQAAV